jgi:hypothetical protein
VRRAICGLKIFIVMFLLKFITKSIYTYLYVNSVNDHLVRFLRILFRKSLQSYLNFQFSVFSLPFDSIMFKGFKPITFTPIVMPSLVRDKDGLFEIPDFDPKAVGAKRFKVKKFTEELKKIE